MQPSLNDTVADTPFRLEIAPGEAVAHAGWQRARAAALAALDQGNAVVLLGQPGMGKTLLLQDLALALRHGGRSVRIAASGDRPDLISAADILMLDDAERLSPAALARLSATDKPLALAAVPSFAERLAGLARPITTVTLEPLPPEEVARFVATRLSSARRPRNTVEPDAVLALAQHSAGLPRLVNVLAQAAVLLAELEQAPRVGRRHVEEAIAMRGGADVVATAPALPSSEPTAQHETGAASSNAPQVSRRRRTSVAAAAGAGLCLLLGGWILLGNEGADVAPTDDRRAAAESPPIDVGNRPQDAHLGDRSHAAETPRNDVNVPAVGEHRPVTQDTPVPPATPVSPDPPKPLDTTTASVPPDLGNAPRHRPAILDGPVAFRGPAYNETIQQGGQMSLVIRRQGASGAVTARFEAWGGLLGSGELAGHLSEDGRIAATGQLMVGKNPFICDLSGTLVGDHLTGSATFVHSANGNTSHTRFTLKRS